MSALTWGLSPSCAYISVAGLKAWGLSGDTDTKAKQLRRYVTVLTSGQKPLSLRRRGNGCEAPPSGDDRLLGALPDGIDLPIAVAGKPR